MPRRAKIVLAAAVVVVGLFMAWQFRKSPGQKPASQSTAQAGAAQANTAQQPSWEPQKGAPSLDVSAAPLAHAESISSSPAARDSSASAAPIKAPSPEPEKEKPVETIPDHTAALPATKPAEPAVPELPANFSGADRRGSSVPSDAQADAPSDQPPERTHKIVDGDSLKSLAERYLGSPNRAAEIFACNRDVLSDPELLPIGIRLRIPSGGSHPAAATDPPTAIAPPAGLTASAAPPTAAESAAASSSTNPPLPSPTTAEAAKSSPLLEINAPGLAPLPPLGEQTHSPGRIYIVQTGDTLAAIAQKLYGDSRHTDAILQANREQLRSEQDLRPGMMLEAP